MRSARLYGPRSRWRVAGYHSLFRTDPNPQLYKDCKRQERRMRRLTPREAIARAYPGYDRAMADRLIAWLDECGYEIVEKHDEASVAPSQATDGHSRARLALIEP